MPQARIEKLITIKSIFDKQGEPKFTVYDTEGNRYTGFKTWEGSPTVEYSLLTMGNHNEPFVKGQQALIQFVRNGQYMNLKGIYPAETTPKPGRVETPRNGQNYASSEVSGRNFEREAYEKCCSIWAAALLGNGKTVTPVELDGFHTLFQAIKASGEKHFNPSKLRQAVQAHAPKVTEPDLSVIQQDEPPIADEDLPPF